MDTALCSATIMRSLGGLVKLALNRRILELAKKLEHLVRCKAWIHTITHVWAALALQALDKVLEFLVH